MLIRILIFAFIIVSCGKEDYKDNNLQEEENTIRKIRYSSITIEENCGFWTDCDFTIRADYNRRPIVLRASFVDNGWPTEESFDEGKCNFQVSLTGTQADQLEALADKLRFCQVENIPGTEGGFDGLFAAYTSGKLSLVYKEKDRGQNEEGKISYICSGRAGYYGFMKKLIVPKAPEDCPSGYKRLFR